MKQRKTRMFGEKERETLKRVLALISVYKGRVLLSLLFAVITVALTLYVPVLIGQAVDCAVGSGQVDYAGLTRIAAKILMAVALTGVCQWLMNHINNIITYRVVEDIRKKGFARIERLPLKYLDTHPAGDLISRLIADVDQFSEGLLMGFTQFFTGLLTILGTLAFMLSINPLITVVVVLLTPVSLFVAAFIAGRTFSMFKEQSEARGELTALTDEIVGNLKVVDAFGFHERAQERFDEINGRLGRCSLRATFFSSLTNPSTRFVNSMVYAAVALSGAFFVVKGRMSVGRLTSFLSYANQYTKPFNEISGVVTELQNALACAGRVFELIDEEVIPEDSAGAGELTDVQGKVDIEDVSFSYTPQKPLIEHLNVRVAPGQRVAIVGPTGCGKTTVINLLMRFYDVNGGNIYVDGQETRSVTRKSLRANCGMVLQDTWLKSASVRENISYGKPEATLEEVIEAAKKAHAHSFIMRMKDGYDTVLSEDGGSLSQGQKQLLCIARVMLSLPPMLILDEATSSIDTRTEIYVQKAFAEMMKSRTSFIVAHRLSTIREADVILVMRDGHIVEQGRHEELLEKKGFYEKIYRSQFVQG